MATKSSRVHVQISVKGKAVSKLSHRALVELVTTFAETLEAPEGIDVQIQLWRAGNELDWQSEDPRAAGLRTLIRRTVQRGRFPFQVRSH